MTILWLIERLLVKPTEGSLANVVIAAEWRCNGNQDQYNGTCYGSCSFAPPSDSFTPYPDLTQEQVLGWCYANGVDKTTIESNVSLQIEHQINPPVVFLSNPWGPPVPPTPVDGGTDPMMMVPSPIEQTVPVLVADSVLVVDTSAE
jgi:hypothetical protein